MSSEVMTGRVLRIDRFGNLVTNIDRGVFEKFAQTGGIQIRAGGETIGRLVGTYADTRPEELCALFGSSDHLEIAVHAGNASEHLRLARGAVVTVHRIGSGL